LHFDLTGDNTSTYLTLVLLVMYETFYAKESYWAPYLRLLPKSFDGALLSACYRRLRQQPMNPAIVTNGCVTYDTCVSIAIDALLLGVRRSPEHDDARGEAAVTHSVLRAAGHADRHVL
jgi:hypothetical protein